MEEYGIVLMSNRHVNYRYIYISTCQNAITNSYRLTSCNMGIFSNVSILADRNLWRKDLISVSFPSS